MLFTWDTTNLCIVFPQWRIYSTFSLLMSLIGVIVLTAGYEFVREMSRQYEASSKQQLEQLPRRVEAPEGKRGEKLRSGVFKDEHEDVQERSSLLGAGKNVEAAEKKQKILKAVFYAVQVFYSFFIM
ncbi:MAG: hypothetical protein L6R40_001337 [Gallowayella cf. fulva]|nr:MAG: hypothetical protein L6R40_001337 [Xanthomendoza cf. fulva]